MPEHYLDPLLSPGSIALVGASDRPDSPGKVLARMVIESDYAGDVYPVNPGYSEILGQTCYPYLESLPVTVDHVIIALGNPHLESALQEDATQRWPRSGSAPPWPRRARRAAIAK